MASGGLKKFIVTAASGIVSFVTNIVHTTKVVCEFSPVQSGSGDPSPSNVRAISGWTGCEIIQAGANCFNPSADTGVQYNTSPKSADLYCLIPGVWQNNLSYINTSVVTLQKTTTGLKYTTTDARYKVGYFIKVKRGMTTKITCESTENINVCFYQKDWTAFTRIGAWNSVKGNSVVVPDDAYYMEYVFGATANTESEFTNINISVSDNSGYSSYTQISTKSINWNLPDEYQKVEYIESTGTQYIELDYVPQRYDEITSKFSMTSVPSGASNSMALFSAGTGTYQLIFLLANVSSGNSVNGAYYKYFASGDATRFNFYPSANTQYTVHVASDGGVTCNGYSNSSSYGGSLDANENLFLMKRANNTAPFMGRLYSFKIQNDGETVVELIPCYRKSDDVIGLYDYATGTFYTNAGTGTFTKGSDVTSPGTVYGGTVTLNEDGSADLVVNCAKMIVSGSDVTAASNVYTNVKYAEFYKPLDCKFRQIAYASTAVCVCDIGNVHRAQGSFDNSARIYQLAIAAYGTVFWYGFPVDTDLATMQSTLDGAVIVYELKDENKQTYHFNSIGALQSFVGTNSIWHNMNGSITVEYYKNT